MVFIHEKEVHILDLKDSSDNDDIWRRRKLCRFTDKDKGKEPRPTLAAASSLTRVGDVAKRSMSRNEFPQTSMSLVRRVRLKGTWISRRNETASCSPIFHPHPEIHGVAKPLHRWRPVTKDFFLLLETASEPISSNRDHRCELAPLVINNRRFLARALRDNESIRSHRWEWTLQNLQKAHQPWSTHVLEELTINSLCRRPCTWTIKNVHVQRCL